MPSREDRDRKQRRRQERRERKQQRRGRRRSSPVRPAAGRRPVRTGPAYIPPPLDPHDRLAGRVGELELNGFGLTRKTADSADLVRRDGFNPLKMLLLGVLFYPQFYGFRTEDRVSLLADEGQVQEWRERVAPGRWSMGTLGVISALICVWLVRSLGSMEPASHPLPIVVQMSIIAIVAWGGWLSARTLLHYMAWRPPKHADRPAMAEAAVGPRRTGSPEATMLEWVYGLQAEGFVTTRYEATAADLWRPLSIQVRRAVRKEHGEGGGEPGDDLGILIKGLVLRCPTRCWRAWPGEMSGSSSGLRRDSSAGMTCRNGPRAELCFFTSCSHSCLSLTECWVR